MPEKEKKEKRKHREEYEHGAEPKERPRKRPAVEQPTGPDVKFNIQKDLGPNGPVIGMHQPVLS